MAIMVLTTAPKRLLERIRKAIDDGDIVTWTYDVDGDFVHAPDQWAGKAWLRPSVLQGALVLGILGTAQVPMTKVVYGVYHGRFIEMLLTHFDDAFTSASATAKAGSADDFK